MTGDITCLDQGGKVSRQYRDTPEQTVSEPCHLAKTGLMNNCKPDSTRQWEREDTNSSLLNHQVSWATHFLSLSFGSQWCHQEQSRILVLPVLAWVLGVFLSHTQCTHHFSNCVNQQQKKKPPSISQSRRAMIWQWFKSINIGSTSSVLPNKPAAWLEHSRRNWQSQLPQKTCTGLGPSHTPLVAWCLYLCNWSRRKKLPVNVSAFWRPTV